jgi:Homeodomain-like domain
MGGENQSESPLTVERMFLGTGKPLKPEKRARARRLRAEGWSYKRIARELSVSPSSALYWTRDIDLTPEQTAMNLGKGTPAAHAAVLKRGRAWSERSRNRRREFQEEGRRRARDGETLHQVGCMLYWAEGTKNKNTVCFSNSDPAMIRFFAGFLRECFGVPNEDFTLRINVYLGNGNGIHEIHGFWLDQLDLPETCLRKPTTNHFPTSSSGRRQNRLPYGVCTLRVRRSTWLVQHIYGAIQEYAGFDEPRWLG